MSNLAAEAGELCRGCAFRRGSYANMSAATVKEALDCLTLEREASIFGYHHGLQGGQPTRLCAGYVAAMAADIVEVAEAIRPVLTDLDRAAGTPDTIRIEADAWLASVDPDNRLNAYDRSALWSRRHLTRKDEA